MKTIICVHISNALSTHFIKREKNEESFQHEQGSNSPANGRLAVGRTLSCSKSLPYLCLSKPQGQPTDLEILGELSNLLQINAFLAADHLLGFYN